MELALAIYFIDVLSSEGGHGAIGFVTIILTALAWGFANFELNGEQREKFLNVVPVKTALCLSVFLIVYSWLMPSKDTAYKMLAAYGVTEIAQSEEAKRLGGKSLEVLERAMDEYLEESNK